MKEEGVDRKDPFTGSTMVLLSSVAGFCNTRINAFTTSGIEGRYSLAGWHQNSNLISHRMRYIRLTISMFIFIRCYNLTLGFFLLHFVLI